MSIKPTKNGVLEVLRRKLLSPSQEEDIWDLHMPAIIEQPIEKSTVIRQALQNVHEKSKKQRINNEGLQRN